MDDLGPVHDRVIRTHDPHRSAETFATAAVRDGPNGRAGDDRMWEALRRRADEGAPGERSSVGGE